MQAVLLAAGQSSRFFPLNQKHKCLIKIAGEPLVVHAVRAVKRSGITDIIVITSDNKDFQEVLGNGKKFGVKIQYVIQKQPIGAGDALLKASKFLASDFFLINSNHAEFEELKKAIDKKRKSNKEPIILAAKGFSERKFGALKVKGDQVLEISEKPNNSSGFSNRRIVGVYFLNRDFINMLKKVPSEHYTLENALDKYAKEKKVLLATTDHEILSLKYPWDVLKVKDFILARLTRSISKKAEVAKSAKIIGNVVIEEGVKIMDNVVIQGPCYIGRDSYVGTNSMLRNSTDIEDNVTIGAYMEVKNCLVLERTKTHSGFIGDSVIGSNTRVGALMGTANVRFDRANVRSTVKGEKVDTGLRSLGAIIGNNVVIGERVSTMPGVIIGNNVNIVPSTTVLKNIPDNTIFYTKFHEYVEKKK